MKHILIIDDDIHIGNIIEEALILVSCKLSIKK